MEPRVVKPPGQDLVVESLKSRYGLGGSCPDEVIWISTLEIKLVHR
ncbi:CCDC138 isoform 5 [Pan troglodytes]|uniref:Coiled-coil domain containing 138 n=2 Tax=Homininae TaxID=207598 RepID=F8WF51_HUMAN|nr:CCDC138 isoform 5 [Pan troglodytes]